ncbi:MAG: ABC transporter ATP-binding protein [Methanobacteriota archaeon]|nr:MAG: ABC transporter ATP-binding protein [Euryarchaeota archaeon]
MKKTAIKASKISVELEGKKILKDLSIEINHRELVALVGPFGSGKTTLLRVFNGTIIPEFGDIEILGKKPSEFKPGEIPALAGFLHENPDDQLFLSNVFDDIAFGPRNYGLPRDEVNHRVLSVAKKIGIINLLEREIGSLSFGEKKLIALAGILVMNPELLLLDDPLLGLDFWTSEKVLNLLKQLKKVTTIICTANQWEMLDIADRILFIDNGKIQEEFDSTEEFKNFFYRNLNYDDQLLY